MDTYTGEDNRQVTGETNRLITVFGVGGAGCNAVNNMIQAGLEGVTFVVANTDAQALEQSNCERQIQLGQDITRGLGAGAKPDIGEAAAAESFDEIKAAIDGSSMIFITAGMGGGTGTGAAPVVARAGREAGALTVGVVSKPFDFEGAHRMRQAEAGIEELSKHVDTLIVIPNQNLFLVSDAQTTFVEAFRMADEVLHSGVRGVTDLVVLPGLINLDFSDIRSIMTDMGKAVMGTGEATGDNRAVAAAEAAISNPLLDNVSIEGAQNVLINITGGPDLALHEVDQAANRIRSEADPEANIIFGSAFDQDLDGAMRVSVIATGKDIKPAEPTTASMSGNVLAPDSKGPAESEDTAATAKTESSGSQKFTVRVRRHGEDDTDVEQYTADTGGAEEIDEPPIPQMHFVVCDLSAGVRIFKVPLSKVARVRAEAEAGGLQLFDTLGKAKAAAHNLARRRAYRRVAEGLPPEDPRAPYQDFSRWTEKDVPLYYI
jgi:cell division protein FtsZ